MYRYIYMYICIYVYTLNTGSEKKSGKDTYLVSDYTDTQLHRMGKL